jgi:tRNA (mo5U34)-methyltransferase
MRAIQWFHSIALPEGVTPGRAPLSVYQRRADIIFKDGIRGLSVLDVGSWDGYYAFDAERRGASRVLATDWYCWNGPGEGTKAGFDYAKLALASRVEEKEIDVMDIGKDNVGEFDMTLFLGVIYHIRHPLYVLERLAALTRKLIVIETYLGLEHLEEPAALFYPGWRKPNGPTMGWGWNVPMVEAACKNLGFSRIEQTRTPDEPQHRAIFHAWR